MQSPEAQCTVQQFCAEEDSSTRLCFLPSSHSSCQQKCATLPTLPCVSSCAIHSVCLDEDMNSPIKFVRQNISILSSDSGLGAGSDDEYGEVFTDDEDDDIQSMVEDDSWWIDGSQIAIKKVLNSTSRETVYSGYWHGNVVVHARRSSESELRANVIADVNMLTSIRHENIQLFLGVCDNLHLDHVSIVMDQMKGNSLHNLIHKQGKQFSCQSVLKIASQIAQGVEYLHAKGITHPMLSSKSITMHYRVCISMLSHYGASSGYIESDDLVYLPPEAIKTVAVPPNPPEGLKKASFSVPLSANPKRTLTPEANAYSFGTVVYEMLSTERPYSRTPASTVIWLVGSNNRTLPLGSLSNGKYKQLVKKCWRNNSSERPTFKKILNTLENNTSVKLCGHKLASRFSFSEPKALNKMGL